MASRPIKLTFSPADYNPQGLAKLMSQDMGAVRREYGRLRDIAQKRLARLGASEYAESSAYTFNKDRFIGLRQVKSPAQLAHLLVDVTRFLSARSSTVSGQRGIERDTVGSLQAKGYDFITTDNIRQFGEFMDWYRSRYNQKKGGISEAVAQMFNWAADPEQNISPDKLKRHFLTWMGEMYGEDAKKMLQNARRKKQRQDKKRKAARNED